MNILITGVTSGFGKQIAIDCIKNGLTVIGTGRRQHKLDELKTSLAIILFRYALMLVTYPRQKPLYKACQPNYDKTSMC